MGRIYFIEPVKTMAELPEEPKLSHKSFISTLRPLILVSRVLGLAPVAFTPDGRIGVSLLPVVYTCIIALVIPTVSVLSLAIIYENYSTKVLSFWCANIRHSLSALLSFACIVDRKMIASSYTKIEHFAVPVMKINALVVSHVVNTLALALVCVTWTLQLIGPLETCVSASVTIVHGLRLVLIYAQFGCQVSIVNMALTDLNKQASLIATRDLKVLSLRPIMSRQQQLRETCRSLNKAYGKALLFATAATFLEVVSCIVLPANLQSKETLPTVLSITYCALMAVPKFNIIRICQRTEIEVIEWETQINHQSKYFSVCGAFDLDGGLIMTVLCATVSYITIFLQITS